MGSLVVAVSVAKPVVVMAVRVSEAKVAPVLAVSSGKGCLSAEQV